MTQDVLLTISGLHDMGNSGIKAEENEALEVITPAKYYLKNGKHYILYDEVVEGVPGSIKNKVKITGDKTLEIIKTGITNSHMIFEAGKSNLTLYDTPYGQFHVDVHTRELDIVESEEEISVKVGYGLDVNHEALAECEISLSVKPKEIRVI